MITVKGDNNEWVILMNNKKDFLDINRVYLLNIADTEEASKITLYDLETNEYKIIKERNKQAFDKWKEAPEDFLVPFLHLII
jgi:hypothetical protein